MIDLENSTKKSRKYREKLLYALAAGIIATMFLELGLTQLSANAKDYRYLGPIEDGKLRKLAYRFDKTLSWLLLGYSEYSLQSGSNSK